MNAEDMEFDFGWLRWLLTLCVLAGAANFFIDYNEALQWTALIVDAATGLLLCLYFGHILCRRLQFSLLEFIFMIAVLGNFEGMLFAIPGILQLWLPLTILALAVAAWIFYGMAIGLTQARILGVTSSGKRLLIFAAAWLTTIAPALILSGLILSFGRQCYGEAHKIISRPMAQWGPWLLALGVLGMIIRVWLGRKVARAALRLMISEAKMTGAADE
jgi:hypothetical protein